MPRRDVGPEKDPGTLSRSATRKLDLDIGAFRGLEDSALRGLDPESPAFTFYPKRETFIEEALVTQIPVRDRELLLRRSMSIGGLLDLAVRHELGHALCNDANERNADRVARLLEEKKTICCEGTSKPERHHDE